MKSETKHRTDFVVSHVVILHSAQNILTLGPRKQRQRCSKIFGILLPVYAKLCPRRIV